MQRNVGLAESNCTSPFLSSNYLNRLHVDGRSIQDLVLNTKASASTFNLQMNRVAGDHLASPPPPSPTSPRSFGPFNRVTVHADVGPFYDIRLNIFRIDIILLVDGS